MSEINITNNLYNGKRTKENSVGAFKKLWIQRNKYLFLTKNNYTNESFENFGEMLYSHFAKKLEVPCVECAFAKINFKYFSDTPQNGVLIKNFLGKKSGEELVLFEDIVSKCKIDFPKNLSKRTMKIYDLLKQIDNKRQAIMQQTINYPFYNDSVELINVDIWLKKIQLFSVYYNLDIDLQKTYIQLYKYCILDFFFMQNDRMDTNMGMIVNDETLKLAPLFDNGMCLAFSCDSSYPNPDYYKEIKENRYNIKPRPKFHKAFEKSAISMAVYNINNYEIEKDQYTLNIIYELIKKEPEIRTFVKKLFMINFEKELRVLNEIARFEKVTPLTEEGIALNTRMFKYMKINFLRYCEMRKKQEITQSNPEKTYFEQYLK